VIYLGAVVLAISVLALGIGLLRPVPRSLARLDMRFASGACFPPHVAVGLFKRRNLP
jgi:hypothetical protein